MRGVSDEDVKKLTLLLCITHITNVIIGSHKEKMLNKGLLELVCNAFNHIYTHNLLIIFGRHWDTCRNI